MEVTSDNKAAITQKRRTDSAKHRDFVLTEGHINTYTVARVSNQTWEKLNDKH